MLLDEKTDLGKIDADTFEGYMRRPAVRKALQTALYDKHFAKWDKQNQADPTLVPIDINQDDIK